MKSKLYFSDVSTEYDDVDDDSEYRILHKIATLVKNSYNKFQFSDLILQKYIFSLPRPVTFFEITFFTFDFLENQPKCLSIVKGDCHGSIFHVARFTIFMSDFDGHIKQVALFDTCENSLAINTFVINLCGTCHRQLYQNNKKCCFDNRAVRQIINANKNNQKRYTLQQLR